jgi:hypothetical protein
VLNELKFWHDNLNKVVLMPLVKTAARQKKIIYSDASATGCGAFILNQPGAEMVNQWTDNESQTSSTWRELRAVEIFLGIHAFRLKNSVIKWYTDNQAVTHIVQKGSMKTDLQLLALNVYNICLHNNISISVDWVPRDLNEAADFLSKLEDPDDWGVSQHISDFINRSHGPFTLDPLASNVSKKVKKFYAQYWCHEVAGVDAFAFSWANECVWLVPPPNLICKAIFHCMECGCHGVMVIPKWLSAVFWPVILCGEGWSPGLELLYEYQNPVNFFTKAKCGNDVFSEKKFASNVLILAFNFKNI